MDAYIWSMTSLYCHVDAYTWIITPLIIMFLGCDERVPGWAGGTRREEPSGPPSSRRFYPPPNHKNIAIYGWIIDINKAEDLSSRRSYHQRIWYNGIIMQVCPTSRRSYHTDLPARGEHKPRASDAKFRRARHEARAERSALRRDRRRCCEHLPHPRAYHTQTC